MNKCCTCIISLLLCLVIIFSFTVPASAATTLPGSVDTYLKGVKYWDFFRGDLGVGMLEYLGIMLSKDDAGCPSSPDGYHDWRCDDVTTGLMTNSFFVHCIFCNVNYCTYSGLMSDSLSSDDLPDIYDDYISDLGYSVITDKGIFEYYPSGWHFDWSGISTQFLNNSTMNSYNGGFSFEGPALALVGTYVKYAEVVSDTFSLPPGLYNLHLTSYSGGFHSYSTLYGSTWSIYLQGSNDGITWTNIACAYYDSGGYSSAVKKFVVPFSTVDNAYSQYRCYEPFVGWALEYEAGATLSGARSGFIEAVSLTDSSVASEPSSRPFSLMELIDEFNRLNSYLDDEDSVNLFLGTKDENGNLLGVYSPSVYNEETMVFTEPVSGAQYLTTGWSYDYYARSYDISVAPGTFTFLETDITRIVCRYGDDEVYISYYAADGSLVSEDVFSYVMVSQSSCALDGHSYTVQTIKESTCTSMGERLYTCSVCGDQKVEETSPKDHRVVHSVFEQATCTDPGYAFYTCKDCGTQYGEPVPLLGHDWLPTESSESTYALPADAACPDCSSVDFSSVLDKVGAVYSCTCNDCGRDWLVPAQVTYGYVTYTCSRCGARKTEHDNELDNGLFTSIGRFFADGIRWCTDKLTEFVDGLTSMLDTFNEYLSQIGEHNSSYPSFLSQVVAILPEDMMAVIWFLIVAAVVVAVIKFWFQ